MHVRGRLVPLCWLVLAVPLGAGCGAPDKAVVNGVLQKDGQPFQPAKSEDAIAVTFHHQSQPLRLSAGVDAARGTFVAHGPTGEGIPLGDYKITVHVSPYQSATDRLKGRFADPKKTPLAYSVSRSGIHSITLDLGKGTVTVP